MLVQEEGRRPKVNKKVINRAIALYKSKHCSVSETEGMTRISKYTLYCYLNILKRRVYKSVNFVWRLQSYIFKTLKSGRSN